MKVRTTSRLQDLEVLHFCCTCSTHQQQLALQSARRGTDRSERGVCRPAGVAGAAFPCPRMRALGQLTQLFRLLARATLGGSTPGHGHGVEVAPLVAVASPFRFSLHPPCCSLCAIFCALRRPRTRPAASSHHTHRRCWTERPHSSWQRSKSCRTRPHSSRQRPCSVLRRTRPARASSARPLRRISVSHAGR